MAAEASGQAGLWHFYAAVGNKEAKLATLMELLHTLGSSPPRPLTVCCSSRDALDLLVFALLQSQSFAVTAIHSDMTEKERELALVGFRRGAFGTASGTAATGTMTGSAGAEAAGGAVGGLRHQTSEGEAAGGRGTSAVQAGAQAAAAAGGGGLAAEKLVCVLVVTDVCLKVLPKELLPVGVSLVVEFDLPPSKEVYARRVSTLFGGVKERRSQRCVVVDMVEAGSIAAFRALEGFVSSPIQEVPVRVQDIFAA